MPESVLANVLHDNLLITQAVGLPNSQCTPDALVTFCMMKHHKLLCTNKALEMTV